MKTGFSKIPASEGAQRLVLSLVKECEAAAVRLGSPGDGEALHDFRVSLHRLRCLLRDYRDQLPAVRAAIRKELKRLCARTNPVRDTEAGIALLNSFADKAGGKEKRSLLAAAGQLEGCGSRPRKNFAAGLRREFLALAVKLRACLATGPSSHGASERKKARISLAAVNGKAIRRHSGRLRDGLSVIKALSDAYEIHRARLLAKKLRYILEPETCLDRRASRFLKKIIRLQLLLGKIHDIQVICGVLHRSAGKKGGGAGLAPAGQFIEEKEAGLFRKLEKSWLFSAGSGFFRKLNRYSRR